jgi:hypothetical protein
VSSYERRVMADDRSPVIAPRGTSPAAASDPARDLDDGHYHIYETNPVPWWVVLVWLGFFGFAVAYLIRNLME